MPTSRDPRIDAYIAKAAPFAQPILRHVRKLVHEECPDIEETMKWSFPHFVRDGAIVCGIAAFKAHCALGFWHHEMKAVIGSDHGLRDNAMGQLGRVTKLEDLPPEKLLRRFFQKAGELATSDVPSRPATNRKPRPELPVPPDLTASLAKNAKARKTFTAFSPSHRREYVEWITEAKRPETRAKRLATTLEWLTEGKSRNWKYAGC